MADPAPLVDVLAQALHDLADSWDQTADDIGAIRSNSTAGRRYKIRQAALRDHANQVRATIDQAVGDDP